jgi:signal transduction histidine kinase
MELKMDHMNKMSSLGRIAASIAHEIRNPLTGIRAGVQVLYKRSEKSDIEIYHSLINEIDRMNELVSEILNYSKINKSKKIKCDLYEILVSTLDLYNDSISSLKIDYKLVKKPKYVMSLIDPNQMKQIFINIISNSLNAMDKKNKELFISVYNTNFDNGSKMINIVIKDNGKGIKKENMDKIFDPFYTNHKKGVGLGLSVVKKLVDENNGEIDIKSEYRIGTSVRLIFEVI